MADIAKNPEADKAAKAKKWVVKNPFYDNAFEDAPFREAGYVMPAETSEDRIGYLASLGIIEAK